MFCIHCGTNNDANGKFCVNCGAPLSAPEPAPADPAAPAPAAPAATAPAQPEPASAPEAPEPTPVPQSMQDQTEPDASAVPAVETPAVKVPEATETPAPASDETTAAVTPPAIVPVSQPAASATAQTASAAVKARRGWVKPLTITLVIALVAAGCGLGAFLTWRAGIWGGKIVPNTSDFQPAAGQSLTADVVAKQLNDRGIATQITQIYSGKPKGDFVGLEGAKAGDRIQQGQTVTVQASLGPGVPQGTVGKSAADAETALKDMGVPVTAKEVVVASDSTVPEGSVVVTSPADGQPVPDDQKDKGIYIGVATKGNGIPYDILGKDIDEVTAELKAMGYSVGVEDRLSSKDYIGKVAGSNPAPGTDASTGNPVTLYRGIDGKEAKQALQQNLYGSTMGTVGSPYTLAGRYCAKNGKCLQFDAQYTNSSAVAYGTPSLYQTEGSTSPFKDQDQSYRSKSGTLMVACDAAQQAYCSSPDAQYLINGDTGAFELFPQADLMSTWCGGKAETPGSGQVCVNGQYQTITDWSYAPQPSGATFEMDDFYVVFPAGADLDQLKSSGYFDDAALKDAEGKPAVDTSRPFIVARDKSLYDSTSAKYDPLGNGNPFLPYTGYGTDSHVKMKPAPTDDNVYYLVENSDIDWDSLPDADVSASAEANQSQS